MTNFLYVPLAAACSDDDEAAAMLGEDRNERNSKAANILFSFNYQLLELLGVHLSSEKLCSGKTLPRHDSLLSCFCLHFVLRVYDFTCPSCSFESRNQVGTPDGDQILTDLNTEFAQDGLFACPKEKKFLSANVLDAGFDGKCPSDGAELQEVDAEKAACPQCGTAMKVEETKPLSAGDAAAE